MVQRYQRENAVAYAQKWALSSNPKFYHFGGIGGDCTNFISQCLLAGGGKMNFDKYSGWYYVDVNNRSPSWTSVASLQNFLLNNKGIGPFASIQNIQNLQEGDLIQLRQNPTHFNHTLIITRKIGNQIYVCAHSNDAKDKPLSSYNYLQTLGLHIEGVRV